MHDQQRLEKLITAHYPCDYDTAAQRLRQLGSTLIGDLIQSGLPGAEVMGTSGGSDILDNDLGLSQHVRSRGGRLSVEGNLGAAASIPCMTLTWVL